ncbi:MAG TPA: trypsin-like serine protease [Enhygromyxa sp.]|nr:trypsin-like serine protease [Enhygromyxa sp.]
MLGISGCDLEQGEPVARGPDGELEDQGPTGTEQRPLAGPEEPADEPVIYGGKPVASCGWPTTVSLGGSCTGTLIHPELVVYAAHCGSNYKSIRFGDDQSGNNDGFSVATKYCRTYPGYSGNKKGVDFAYCRLSKPVENFPIVPPLMGCETSVLKPGAEVAVVGFGQADAGPDGLKREVYTKLNSIKNNEAFVGGNGKDSCYGDSGGPVFIQLDDGSWRAFGITSYGGDCGTGGYYSMMHLGMSWFESDSGIDLTPCHDAKGNWDPGPSCGDFPLDPADGGGKWPSCASGPLSGASSTCGAPNGDPNPNPDPNPDPDPEPEPNDDPDSCEGSCGEQAPGGCWCDDACTKYGDCCDDVVSQCKPDDEPNQDQDSCAGSCGKQAPGGCWCDAACVKYGDCCDDVKAECG